MTFAEISFREECVGMLEQFNGHFQKLGWIPLAATGAILFVPFLDWIKEDEKRAADYLAINALDEESAAAAAQANVVAARECAKQYYNGLYRLYRDYDKAVEDAYRAPYRASVAARGNRILGESAA